MSDFSNHRDGGSAAAQCGKALPFRRFALKDQGEAAPRPGGIASSSFHQARGGKAKPYRTVLRQSRWLFSPVILLIPLFVIFVTRDLNASSSKGLVMPVQERPKIRAPELTGHRGWLNTDKPLSLAALPVNALLAVLRMT